MIVCVRAAIESDVTAVITGAADSRIVIAEMAAGHVVVGRIDKSVFSSIEALTQVRIKEIAPRVPFRSKTESLGQESDARLSPQFAFRRHSGVSIHTKTTGIRLEVC